MDVHGSSALAAPEPAGRAHGGWEAVGAEAAWEALRRGGWVVEAHLRTARRGALVLSMGGARGGRRALSGDEVAASMRRASGTAVKAIAVDRGVSAAAASTWLRRAMGKLLLTTSADLVLLFGGWPRGIEARRQGARGREWLEVTYPVHGWPLPACLTPAERRVVAALVAGCPCATIAAQGQIAARTVANQLASAYRKLGVGSSVELFVALHRHASEPTKSD